MKKLTLLTTVLLLIFTASTFAQRYLTEVFPSVTVTSNVIYGNNISVLTGSPAASDLKMDVYEPTGDALTARPLVIVLHTGSFLPRVMNGLPTGSKTDSAVVEMCTLFAKKGYVAVAMDYRLGWNALSSNQDVRAGTFLNAIYRAMQDAKNCVRYFKNDQANSNTYKIDTTKIAVGGFGSGGYIALAYASLNQVSEIQLPKFMDNSQSPPVPYINQTQFGNFDGTNQTTLNLPNYATYSSRINMAFNIGGAIGDTSWINPGEVPIVGLQCTHDPLAPYKTGAVIVPTTGDFVVEASGSYDVIRNVNKASINNNAIFTSSAYNDVYTIRATQINNGYEGLFPFVTPAPAGTITCGAGSTYPALPQTEQGSPWDWWNESVYSATATAYGQSEPTYACNALRGNPDMSPAKGRKYIDTIQGYLTPRIACALGLSACTPNLASLQIVGINVTCNGANNGSATVTASGGTPPYTYSWAPYGGNTATANGLSAGTYTCTVTGGGTATQTVTITQPTVLTATTSQTNVTPIGGNNGSATVAPSGGTPPYAYSWAPSGGTSATASGLSAGTYTCTITGFGSANCAVTKTVTITQPSSGSCNELFISEYVEGSGNDKAIEIYNPSNNAINLTGYSIVRYSNGSTTSTAGGVTNLSGTIAPHDVFVIVNGQLAANSTATSPAVSLALQAMADQLDGVYPSPTYFNGNDAITLEKGGVKLDIFGKIGEDPGQSWSDVFPYTGAQGKWWTKDHTLRRKASVTGGVTVNPTTFNVTAEWDSLPNNTWTGLGTHTSNCQTGFTSLQISQSNVSCNGVNNGAITVNVNGSTGTILYSKNGGSTYQSSNIFGGLSAGTYQIVVKVANNPPTPPQSVTIIQTPSTILTSFSKTNVNCFGNNTGSASITASGGTGTLTYNWLPYGGTSATANSLTTGTYTCTVTDSNGCIATANAVITQPSAALSISTYISKTQCGAPTGYITASVTGGTLPRHYLWSNGDTTYNIQNLAAGNYTLAVTDGNGCTASTPVLTVGTAHPNFGIAFTAIATTGTAPFFAGFTNATPTIANYNFTWFWGDATSTASNGTNVTHTYTYGGFYDVSLVAVNTTTGCADTLKKVGYVFVTGTGCTHTSTVSPSAPFAGCTGDTLVLTASTNASSGYTYQWNMNSTLIGGATSNTLTVTQSGYYSVTVLQAGCPVTSTVVQVNMNTNPAQPLITATGTIVPCVGGSVTLTASPLNGGNYLWNTSATTQSITVSTPGVYSVTENYGSSLCSSTSAPFYLGTSLPVVPLCLITVDTLSTHNIVVWEKSGLTSAIDSFRIYRETMTNVYSNIASVSFDSLSEFHDYGANPNTTSYKYKLVAIDTCGSISTLSDFHNSIHLQNLGNGNLQWTLYDIEGAGNPVNYYVVYRDDTGTGNFLPISSTIPGGNSTYTDVNYSNYANARYRVDATWSISCSPTRTVTTTRSNILHPTTTSVSQAKFANAISIFPNPASTRLNISGLSKNDKIITVTNVLGKTVRTIETNGNTTLEVNVESLPNGVYFIKINNRSYRFVKG